MPTSQLLMRPGKAAASLVVLSLVLCFPSTAADPVSLPAPSLASLYSLSASASLPFPSQTLSSSSAVDYLQSTWFLSKGKIENGEDDIAFVTDPAPSANATIASSTVPTASFVLQVTYPADSYSHATGGAEFYSLPLNSTSQPFQSMLLSYELAFSPDFDWVEGGKLPGLRGGPDAIGCSGGSEPTGSDCFSVRLMWRTSGLGEVYAYIPSSTQLCSESDIICNSDFGISIQRGSFTFQSGTWSEVALLVQLNDPPSTSNGVVELYMNNTLVIRQSNLQLRTSSAIESVGGFFFSTFFGGNDSTWETPIEQYSYYKNVQLWASAAASNVTATNSTSPGTTTSSATACNWHAGWQAWAGLLGALTTWMNVLA